MSSAKKNSSQNIVTAAVAIIALILLVTALLVKTGVFEKKEEETTLNTVVESSVVLASETMENGDVVYYTMVDYYVKPGVSAFFTYPTSATSSTETTVPEFLEETEIVAVTDENGNPVLKEDGTPKTEIWVYTVPNTTQPASGEGATDENGNPVTAPADGTQIQPDSTAATTASPEEQKKKEMSKEDAAASAIIAAINAERIQKGLPELSVSTELKSLAATKSTSLILPGLYGKVVLPSASYNFTTKYGGSELAGYAVTYTAESALSENISEAGAAVIRYKDTYYTTVIFR